MPDMFQGVVAPDVNTTKTTASVAPQYITDYYSDIALSDSQKGRVVWLALTLGQQSLNALHRGVVGLICRGSLTKPHHWLAQRLAKI